MTDTPGNIRDSKADQYFKAVKAEINRLQHSQFVKNVTTMMTGTAFAQFIPVLISPVLTRIFMPEDFGILTIFLSYSMIVSTIITGKYEMAVMLPKSNEESANLGGLATMLTVLLSSLFMIFLIFFKDVFILLPGADKISKWLLILPVTAGLIAYGNILNYWLSRNKNFQELSKGKFLQTAGSAGFNVGIGLISPMPVVLILGNVLGQLLNAAYLTLMVFKYHVKAISLVSTSSFKNVGSKFIKFPLYDIPNSLSYSIATQGMNLVFSKFFGEVVLGYFSMVQRILITPFSFISLSFTQVFFEKMSDVYNNNRSEFNKFLKKAQNRLIVYFFIPFFGFVFLSKYIVPFVFGAEWKVMYQYIFVLSPMIFFNLTTSPYTYIFKILNKQEIALILNIARMIVLIGAVVAGKLISDDPFLVFTMFSVASVILTAISIIICLRYLNAKMSVIFKTELITLVAINILLYYLVRSNIF